MPVFMEMWWMTVVCSPKLLMQVSVSIVLRSSLSSCFFPALPHTHTIRLSPHLSWILTHCQSQCHRKSAIHHPLPAFLEMWRLLRIPENKIFYKCVTDLTVINPCKSCKKWYNQWKRERQVTWIVLDSVQKESTQALMLAGKKLFLVIKGIEINCFLIC